MFTRAAFFRTISTVILLLAVVKTSVGQNIKYNDTFTIYWPTFAKYGSTTDSVKSTIFIKGQYKDSLPVGHWMFFDTYKKMYESHYYENGLLNGTFTEGDYKKGNYVNGLKTGEWKENFGTGTYINDTLQGWQKTSYNGVYFVNGKATGPYYKLDHWDKDTVVWGQYVNNSREGKWIIWGDHSMDNAILNFKNNELEDTSYYLRNDSTVREKTTYRNGKKDGPEYYYGGLEEGDVFDCNYCIKKTMYKNNSKHGEEVVTTPQGDTLSYTFYNNDRKEISLLKNMKGRLREKHWYKEYGYDSCIKWDDAGKQRQLYVSKANYGQPGEATKRWDAAGKLEYRDSIYKRGRSSVTDIYGYTGGVLVSERHFVDGKRNGRFYKKGAYDLQYSEGELAKRVSGKGTPDDEEDRWYLYDTDVENYPNVARDYEGYDDVAAPPEEPAPNRLYNRNSKATPVGFHSSTTIQYAKEYIKSNDIIAQKLKGEVKIKVYVMRYGFASSPRIVKTAHPDLDAEALRIVLRMMWDPEYKDGLVVPTWHEVTVVF